jgi:hypothetical protein
MYFYQLIRFVFFSALQTSRRRPHSKCAGKSLIYVQELVFNPTSTGAKTTPPLFVMKIEQFPLHFECKQNSLQQPSKNVTESLKMFEISCAKCSNQGLSIDIFQAILISCPYPFKQAIGTNSIIKSAAKTGLYHAIFSEFPFLYITMHGSV